MTNNSQGRTGCRRRPSRWRRARWRPAHAPPLAASGSALPAPPAAPATRAALRRSKVSAQHTSHVWSLVWQAGNSVWVSAACTAGSPEQCLLAASGSALPGPPALPAAPPTTAGLSSHLLPPAAMLAFRSALGHTLCVSTFDCCMPCCTSSLQGHMRSQKVSCRLWVAGLAMQDCCGWAAETNRTSDWLT